MSKHLHTCVRHATPLAVIPVAMFHHADPGVVCGEPRTVHAETEARHNGDPTDESPG